MALIDDPVGWILRLFHAEEREGRGVNCAIFPNGIVPCGIPLARGERVYGIYKDKYYFTPESFIMTTMAGLERIPWAMICSCTSRHGEGMKTAKLTLTDGRVFEVKVGDFAVGWCGRISQLFHQMIERWGANAILGPQLMAIDEFFRAEVYEGCIGCNLTPHPGINVFRKILMGLMTRPDVHAVYALVSEFELDGNHQLFTDTILVFGSISVADLQGILAPILPDEVGPADSLGIVPAVLNRHKVPALVAWWD